MQSIEVKYRNLEHETIFNQTKHIPGWQEPGDSIKLYEMAFENGDVILEIGTYGGRSAVVELRGALANQNRTTPPQFFGVEIDIHGIWRSYRSIKEAGLEEYALLFHGKLENFVETFSVKPTMVFVDGDHRYEGVKKDLLILSKFLSPGTSVLCHDYRNPENDTGILGVRRAVNEFVEEGYASFEGTCGCYAFLVMTEKCEGEAQTQLTQEEFLAQKIRILELQGHKLYQNWQNSEGDRAARLESIKSLQMQLSGNEDNQHELLEWSELDKLKKKLKTRRESVKNLREKVEQLSLSLGDAHSEIQAMKTSKFWKIRNVWMRAKKKVGL
ncbi:MAG: class I SAM-dependent methyltransferase [Cyanobacteria bacterium P01_E01_bin.6]